MFRIKFIVLIVIMMQVRAESRNIKSKFKYHKVRKGCSELPAPVLNGILGAAFNSRYALLKSLLDRVD